MSAPVFGDSVLIDVMRRAEREAKDPTRREEITERLDEIDLRLGEIEGEIDDLHRERGDLEDEDDQLKVELAKLPNIIVVQEDETPWYDRLLQP